MKLHRGECRDQGKGGVKERERAARRTLGGMSSYRGKTMLLVLLVLANFFFVDEPFAGGQNALLGDLSFTRTDFPVGGEGPWSVTVTDFDLDNLQDLAITNRESQTVSVLLGRRYGKFGDPKTTDPIAHNKHSHSALLNGDTLPDLAVALVGSNSAPGTEVAVLLGKGNGGFEPPLIFQVGVRPTSVSGQDFNRDGIQDLAVTNRDSNSVSILLGRGDGTFQPARHIPVAGGPRFSAVADLDGDGIHDLATANWLSNNVSVLLGRGDGRFRLVRNLAVGRSPGAVIAGDFNRDGILDLAAANCGCVTPIPDSTVSVLLGRGGARFLPARNFQVGVGPSALAIGDFNADGIQDLAVPNWGTSETPGMTVSILLGLGDGAFEGAQHFSVGEAPTDVGVADFDGDGRNDLAVVNNLSDSVSILLNVPY